MAFRASSIFRTEAGSPGTTGAPGLAATFPCRPGEVPAAAAIGAGEMKGDCLGAGWRSGGAGDFFT
jgi:hypothetical protein